MSRRIDTGTPIATKESPRADALKLGKASSEGGDDYLGRLVKYIPAEIVALFVSACGIVPVGKDGAVNCSALWVIFALSFVLVPAYLWFVTSRSGQSPLWPQIILGTIAFPVWAFAIGGPFKCLGWYQGWIASITLAFVTVVFGMYRPRPGT